MAGGDGGRRLGECRFKPLKTRVLGFRGEERVNGPTGLVKRMDGPDRTSWSDAHSNLAPLPKKMFLNET